MPTPASSPTADVELVYLPKFAGLVTVNVVDVPYLRLTQGALSPAEYAAKQAAEATEQAASTTSPKPTGKPFKSKAEKDAEKSGEGAPDGEGASAGDSTTTP